MEAKNTGAIMATIFFIILCTIIGTCFMAFVYADKKVQVKDPQIAVQSGIEVLDEKGSTISSVKLSVSKLGLKPVTGEEDAETKVPSTVNDKMGTEGLYGSFSVKSSVNWALYVTDIQIEAEKNTDEERENIKVGLKDVPESTQTLEGNKVLIATGLASETPVKHTLFVWLHAHAGDDLIGSKISFTLSFEAV